MHAVEIHLRTISKYGLKEPILAVPYKKFNTTVTQTVEYSE